MDNKIDHVSAAGTTRKAAGIAYPFQYPTKVCARLFKPCRYCVWRPLVADFLLDFELTLSMGDCRSNSTRASPTRSSSALNELTETPSRLCRSSSSVFSSLELSILEPPRDSEPSGSQVESSIRWATLLVIPRSECEGESSNLNTIRTTDNVRTAQGCPQRWLVRIVDHVHSLCGQPPSSLIFLFF